jgi:hypothetical protein
MKPIKNKQLWTSALVGAVIAGRALAGNVTLPYVFQPNTPARASEVNANFNAVKAAVDDNATQIQALSASVDAGVLQVASQLTALETQASSTQANVMTLQSSVATLQTALADLSARVSALEANKYNPPLYAFQTADLLNSVSGNWANIPGASVTVTTTKASTVLRLSASGAIARYGGTAPWVRCALRFTLNGFPLMGTDPTLGQLAVSPSAPGSAAEYIPFYLFDRITVPAGSHTIGVQMARVNVAGMTDVGECAIFRWTFSRTRLEVESL